MFLNVSRLGDIAANSNSRTISKEADAVIS